MPALIRLAGPADGAALAEIYAPYVIGHAISFETIAPTAEEMAQRIAKTTVTHPWLVCERNGMILGYVYASKHRERAAYQWSVDVTAYTAPQAHRSGVGKALYGALFRILALQGYRSAYGGIALPNDASIGLHTAVGFELVGVYRNVGYKLGRWRDVAWYGRDLGAGVDAGTGQPGDPLPLAAVMQLPAYAAALSAAAAQLA